MAVHPDPLPFTEGEGNLRWHHVRVTEQGSRQVRSSSPLPARSGERHQGEGCFRLHTYGLERGFLGSEELPDARFAQSQHLA